MDDIAMPHRSEQRFLRNALVCDLVRDLSQASRLTIYCGAGVTINRTNLSWAGMIRGSVSELAAYIKKQNATPPPNNDELSALLEDLGTEAVASVLYGLALNEKEKNWTELQKQLSIALSKQLYGGVKWKDGYLARNVIRLARLMATYGKPVSILTTNYDILLEELWKDDFDNSGNEGGDSQGLDIFVPDQRGKYVHEGNPRKRKAATQGRVSLTYLHGRIPHGTAGGYTDSAIVLSELDYAKYRKSIEKKLLESMKKDAAVLILGSSLRDLPLINSLIKMKNQGGPKFCLMPIESFQASMKVDHQGDRMISLIQSRGKALGINLRISDFKFQIAQCVEEILLGLQARNAGVDYEDIRYGVRLVNWWNAWKNSRYAVEAALLQEELANLLSDVRGLANLHHRNRDSSLYSPDEHLKIELWVRKDPEKYRSLALWASSNIIRLDRKYPNSQKLERESRVASVVAFTEGRVLHQDVRQVSGDNIGGLIRRWNSYLSIPIHVGTNLQSRLPVAVVTIASSRHSSNSMLPGAGDDLMSKVIELVTGNACSWLGSSPAH